MNGARFLILALLLLFLSSCGGTEAGNPSLTNIGGNIPNPTYSGEPQDLASLQFVSTVCNKLIQCNSTLTVSECTNGVEAQTNLTTSLGVAASFGSITNVIQAETVGTLRPDPVRTQTCLSEISTLSCTSTQVKSAYNNTSSGALTTSYTSVINMIPTSGTSCPGIF